MHTSNEIAIRVIHRQRGTDSVWSLNTLAEKVLTMRDMYQRIEEGGPGPLLVGVVFHVSIYLVCIHFRMIVSDLIHSLI